MTGKGGQPTLTDAIGMGGVNAEHGFDYQRWDALVRLPEWLLNPTFESLIFEGLEDVEARFFAPHAPRRRVTERYQAKSGNLTPTAVRKVFEAFQTFDSEYPELARVHTLVTPGLPASLKWVGGDAERIRKARPFYAPFPDVMSASDDAFTQKLIHEYGHSLGRFVAQAVEVHGVILPDEAAARTAFGAGLNRCFPHLDLRASQMEGAFAGLSSLAQSRRGECLSREDLQYAIESSIGVKLSDAVAFPIHVRTDQEAAKTQVLEIDGTPFSGGGKAFPGPESYSVGLVEPLACGASWLKARGERRIAVGGSYRLSTAFVLGSSFRSAAGFELEIPTKDGVWNTDDRPRGDESYQEWEVREPESSDDEILTVSVGILRDPAVSLQEKGVVEGAEMLRMFLPSPLDSARATQAAVGVVKTAVDSVAARLGVRRVDLYLATPAVFAVALGHRWNAMPETQLYEFVARENGYTPTAFISAAR